jgi:hypothetical protein
VTKIETLLLALGPSRIMVFIYVLETIVNEVVVVKLKFIAMAFIKLEPLMTIVFLPIVGLLVGLIVLMIEVAILL